jgi:hypothetical protein
MGACVTRASIRLTAGSAAPGVRFTRQSGKSQRKSFARNPENDAEPWEGNVDDPMDTALLILLGY